MKISSSPHESNCVSVKKIGSDSVHLCCVVVVVGVSHSSFSITIAFVAWLLHVSRELIIKILQAKLKLLKCGTFENCNCPTIGHDRESIENETNKNRREREIIKNEQLNNW